MTLKVYKILKVLFYLVTVIVTLILIFRAITNIPKTDKEIILYLFITFSIIWIIYISYVLWDILKSNYSPKKNIIFLSLSILFMIVPIYGTVNYIINLFSERKFLDWTILLILIIDCLFILNLFGVKQNNVKNGHEKRESIY